MCDPGVVCVTVRGHHETKMVPIVPVVPMVPMVLVWNVSCLACQYEDILLEWLNVKTSAPSVGLVFTEILNIVDLLGHPTVLIVNTNNRTTVGLANNTGQH